MACPWCKQANCDGPERAGPYCCEYAKACRRRPSPPHPDVVFQMIRGRVRPPALVRMRKGISVRGAASSRKRAADQNRGGPRSKRPV